jgi:phage baseplate assembly protein W
MADRGHPLGQGVHFPPGVDVSGRWAWSAGADNIRESIRIILMTELQERVMLPAFGGGLKRFLFQPNIASTHRMIQETIVQALSRWERRVGLEDVTVDVDPNDDRAALAIVRYKAVATGIGDAIQVRVQLA